MFFYKMTSYKAPVFFYSQGLFHFTGVSKMVFISKFSLAKSVKLFYIVYVTRKHIQSKASDLCDK